MTQIKDVFSVNTEKRHEFTTADRVRILEAVAVHGIGDGGWKVWRATGFPRWNVVAIATCAGYGTPLFEQNLAALKAVAA